MRNQPRTRTPISYLLAILLLSGGAAAMAQPVPPVLGPTPTPGATASPTPAPTPSPTPTPSGTPDPFVPPWTGTPEPSTSPGPSGSPSPGESPGPAEDELGDPRVPPGFEIPRIARTPGRNTVELVRILEAATVVGMSLEEALIEGMGRFPVAGLAYYSDDWMNPRFTPTFHLHEGLDIFADFGTPIRAPDAGVVTRVTDGAVGGLAVWMRGQDGTTYYFAHMQDIANGIEPGRPVEIGTVLGTVGDSGNARGGAPHLHFEIHAPNEVPPKPYVDAWLDEALAGAPAWVEARVSGILDTRKLLRTEQSLAGLLAADAAVPGATPEYSLLLTLLDPVGGSVGLLPRLPLVPTSGAAPSEAFVDEIIRQRVTGSLLTALSYGSVEHALHD